jgi:hypothetical protein
MAWILGAVAADLRACHPLEAVKAVKAVKEVLAV